MVKRCDYSMLQERPVFRIDSSIPAVVEHDRSGENGDQVPCPRPMAKSSRPAERCRGSVRSGIIADHETGRQGGTAAGSSFRRQQYFGLSVRYSGM